MLRYIIPHLYIHSFHLFSSINGTSAHTTISHQHQQQRKIFLQFPLNFFPLNHLYGTHLTFPLSSLHRHIYLAASLAIAVTIADRWIIRFSLFYRIFRNFHGKFIIFGFVCWQKWSFQACGSVGKIAFHFHTTMTPFFSTVNFFTFSPTPPFLWRLS